MSDNIYKNSGFGIGELGSIPESTLEDEMDTLDIVYGDQSKFTFTDAGKKNASVFNDLDSLLDHLRMYVVGYTMNPKIDIWRGNAKIGSINADPGAEWHTRTVLLKYAVPLNVPEVWCDECGSRNISRGKCRECGETDMVRTEWYKFVTEKLTVE